MAIIAPTSPTDDFTAAREPFALFASWFADATAKEINDPNAMALATVDASGLPNVRMVLLNGLDEAGGPDRGFVFFSNIRSAKGRELLASHTAAVVFHWKSLRRQVRARGTITTVPDAEADAYFDARPRGSRIGAWASEQSQPLASRAALEEAVASFERKFGDGPIPRPARWTGFRLTPVEVEFWHDRPFRLHDRIVMRRSGSDAAWDVTRLYP